MSERTYIMVCANHEPHIAQCDYCQNVREFSTEREVYKALIKLVQSAKTLETLGLLAERSEDTDAVKHLRADFLQKLKEAAEYC